MQEKRVTKIKWADCPTKTVQTLIKKYKIMKRRNLRNSLAICLYLVLAVVITGCSEFMPSDGRYYIKDIEEYRNHTDYHIVQVKGHGHAFYRDSVGKYRTGDTIRFVPNNH